MYQKRSIRLLITAILIVCVSALTAAAESSWSTTIFGPIETFLGLGNRAVRPDSPQATNGKILFFNGYGNTATIYITDPAVGNDTPLGPGSDPVWKPDGSAIMFLDQTSQPDNYSYEIKMMNPDGTNPHSLATKTYISLAGGVPAWSPDGTQIVFAQKSCGACTGQFDSPFNTDLYVANIDGSNPVRITHVRNRTTQANQASSPTWQPVIVGGQIHNGKIAFVEDSYINGRNYDEIFTIPGATPCLDDSTCHPTNLSNNTYNNSSPWSGDRHPAWSPDGTKIVFDSDRNAAQGFGDIYVINPQGTLLQRVTSDNYEDDSPTFSPDGTKIAWLSGYRPGTGGDSYLYVMPSNGNPALETDQQRVAVNYYGDSPTWGPAGAPTCLAKPDGLIAWYQGEGDENDASGSSNNGTTLGTITFSPGKVGQAFTFSGTNTGVQIPDSPNNKPATALTVDTWVKFSSLTNDLQYLVFKRTRGTSILRATLS